MSRGVNLLLLLSALLSALTGVGASVRQAPAPAAMAQQARQAAPASARVVAKRPVQRLATLARSALAPVMAALAISPAEPAFAGRRRE